MSRKLRTTAAVSAVTLFASLLGIVAAQPAAAAQPVVTAIPNPSLVDDAGRGAFKLEVENATPNGVVAVTVADLNAPAACDPRVVDDPGLIGAAGASVTETADDQGRVAFLISYGQCSAANDIQVNVTDNATGLTTTLVVPLNNTEQSTAGADIQLTPTGEGISGQEDQVAGQVLLTGWAPGSTVTVSVNESAGTCTTVGFSPVDPNAAPTAPGMETQAFVADAEGNVVTGFFADGCQPNSTLVFTASSGPLSDTATFNVLPRGSQTPGTGTEICGDGIDNDGDGLIDEGCPPGPTPTPTVPPGEVCGDGIDNNGNGLIDENCPPAGNATISGTLTTPGLLGTCTGTIALIDFLGFLCPRPVVGATVTATGTTDSGTDTTSASGEYTITGLEAGSYDMSASEATCDFDPDPVTVTANGSATSNAVCGSAFGGFIPGGGGGFGGIIALLLALLF